MRIMWFEARKDYFFASRHVPASQTARLIASVIMRTLWESRMPVSATVGTRISERRIRRAVIKTTHQGIVFGAIGRLEAPDAEAWRRMFLRYGRTLADGAEAPDSDFRDFRNHALFATDRGWGGAADKAQAWYRNLVTALGKREWRNAAYCAGVLAHYLVDALHPFHTDQSAAENDIHFAVDTAVWLGFPLLARQAASAVADAAPALSDMPDFLGLALAAGAAAAHRDYETLIAHFDLQKARKNALAGLDATGQRVMTDTIARSTALLAAVLDRAIAEAGERAPQVSLALVGFRAWVATPLAAHVRERRARRMRRTVRRMAREKAKTGRVEKYLGDEERIKRDSYALHVMTTRPAHVQTQAPAAVQENSNIVRFDLRPHGTQRVVPDGRPNAVTPNATAVVSIGRPEVGEHTPRPMACPIDTEPPRLREFLLRSTDPTGNSPSDPVVTGFGPNGMRPVGQAGALSNAAAAILTPALSNGLSNFRDRRTETRPRAMVPDPGAIAAVIARNAPEGLLADKAFAGALPLLVIPKLSQSAALLIAGAGYPTVQAVASAHADRFCADILKYALTQAGRQSLRDAPPPDIETVREWADAARAFKAA